MLCLFAFSLLFLSNSLPPSPVFCSLPCPPKIPVFPHRCLSAQPYSTLPDAFHALSSHVPHKSQLLSGTLTVLLSLLTHAPAAGCSASSMGTICP